MKKRVHKRAPKRLKKQKKSYQKLFINIGLLITTILIAIFVGGYFYLENKQIVIDIKKDTIVQITNNNVPKKQKLTTFEEKTKALEIEYSSNIDNNVYIEKQTKKKQKEDNTFHYEEPDYGKIGDIEPEIPQEIILDDTKKQTVIKENIKQEKNKPKNSIQKPKLAIIIDDVTNKNQIKKIQNIGYRVNMSFLPPTKGHKNSATITNNLDNYMIHLPLQASNFKYEEANTLHVTDNIVKIENRIRKVKQWYPKAKFINNHTGSKFTSNAKAMDKLFQILKKYDYNFIDSRTTAKSVAKLSAKKYGIKMFSRNIFLDNNKNKKYIQNQLKKAIKSAKKYGLAIAIGHPYGITLKTLKESKYLLDDLELVYVNKL